MNKTPSKARRLTQALVAVAAVAGLVGAATASPALIRPQSIIVNPVPPTPAQVGVNVSVDRPSYRIGEPIRVTVNVSQDAYVYLFSIHADGVIDLVLPNKLAGGASFLRAGESRSFPPVGANYTFTVGGPLGTDKVLAVASKQALNLDQIASFNGSDQFATVTVQGTGSTPQAASTQGLARALSIVVQPVPQTDWVTAFTSYTVRR